MFKLIKWIGIGTIVAGATGYFLFGSHITSYLDTAASSIRDGISDKIPVEFELKRAERLIRAIDPQLHSARVDVAQAEVELENLQKDVARLERDVSRGKEKLQHVSAGMSGQTSELFQLAGYAKTRVELDLERTFDAFRNNVGLLKGKKALIERQARAVEAAKSHLEAVRSERARLEDMILALKTQKRQLDALAASSKSIDLDDTALGQARDVLNEVKNRLDVAQRLLEDDIYFSGGDPVRKSERNITAEIDRFFSESGDDLVLSDTGPSAHVR